jgi:uncharacterized protein (UPF0261 family)
MMASRFTSRSTLHNANNTTLELQQDLARSSPEQCVTLTHSVPSVQMYCALRTKLDNCSDKWLQVSVVFHSQGIGGRAYLVGKSQICTLRGENFEIEKSL